MSGSSLLSGFFLVRPVAVVAGEIIAMPALFRIGIETAAAPELYGPM